MTSAGINKFKNRGRCGPQGNNKKVSLASLSRRPNGQIWPLLNLVSQSSFVDTKHEVQSVPSHLFF